MDTVIETDVDREFIVDESPELDIRNMRGRIAILGVDKNVIHVKAQMRGHSSAIEQTVVDMLQDGDTVRVETRSAGRSSAFHGEEHARGHRSRWLGHSGKLAAVDYEIAVPHNCRVRVSGLSCEISIAELRAPVTAKTVSGDMVLRSVTGEVRVNSVSGDLSCSDIRGEFVAQTVSGDVTVASSHIASFNVNSVSGDCVIDSPLRADHHFYARSVSGSLRLLVPPGAGLTVHMKTVSGRVRSQLPAEVLKEGRRQWLGRINGGGATIELKTVSGDIEVAASSQSPAHALAEDSVRPSEEASRETNQAVTEVLRAVQRGEMSVDEALQQLG